VGSYTGVRERIACGRERDRDIWLKKSGYWQRNYSILSLLLMLREAQVSVTNGLVDVKKFWSPNLSNTKAVAPK